MAHFAKNSTNYNGARSKTTVSTRELADNKSKKGKKKSHESGFKERNAWGKDRNQNNAWQDPAPEKRREPRTLWSDIEHEFPACDTTAPVHNVWEQKQKKLEQPNVWVQRQMKLQQNKALEPRDEDEEEKMIRLALELSKRETETNSMRRRLEEEYRMQEQMLKSNPDAFKEFQFEDSLNSFSEEKFPFNNSNAESEELDDGKYAMALKSNPRKTSADTSNSKSYNNWDDSGDNFKRNQPSFNYKEIDNWEGYSTKINVSPAKITSNGDNWGDIENTTEKNNLTHQAAAASNCESYDNWGDIDDANQSSSNYSKNDCWDDYEEPHTKKDPKVSQTSSKRNTFDNWDDIEVSNSTNKGYEHNIKEGKMADTHSKSMKQQETCIQPVEKEMGKPNTHKNVRKVVDMFGGWGSTTTTENASRKDASAIVEKNNGKSISKIKPNGLKYKASEIETLTTSVQELQTEDIPSSKKDSALENGFQLSNKDKKQEFEKLEKNRMPKVSDIDTKLQGIEHETHSSDFHGHNTIHSSVISEATVSEKTKLSEQISNSKIETKSESPLLNKVLSVDPVFSSNTTTSINQTPSFLVDTINNENASNKNELSYLSDATKIGAITNHDTSCFESENYSKVSTHNAMANNESFDSFDQSNQLPVSFSNEASKQVPTFKPNEYINPPKQVPTFQSSVCINPPQQAAAQSNESINSPKQASAFQSNEYIQPCVHNSAFQSINSNMNNVAPNIASPIPSSTFSPPEFMNTLPSPSSQMGNDSINPNLIGGINPLLMQYMQMFSNPFLATQWQAWEMYYRTMGMPIGPMIFPQVPMIPGLRNPTIGDPINSPFGNNHNGVNLRSNTAIGQPVINTPINPANDILSPHEQYNFSNERQATSSTSALPDVPLKLDEETESLLRSFLSPKEEAPNDNEPFIKPPVVVSDSTSESICNITSTGKTISSVDYQSDIDKSCSNNLSKNLDTSNVFQSSSVEPIECIGWGDLDCKTSSKSSQNTWDEDVDGWGSENSTTKSMGNPSRYNSAKSANRQPSSQPNFHRFRK